MLFDLDNLPDWLDIDQKVVSEEPISALERFIHEQEPAGDMGHLFRKLLCLALNEVVQSREIQDS